MQSAPRASDDLLARMKDLHPLMIDLSLERIERLLLQLGSPENSLPPVVHIAGTNGKGSTTAFLKAMLEAAGKRVATYTSPHLVNFHERITLPDASAGPDAGRDTGTGAALQPSESTSSSPISETQLVTLLTRVLDVNAGAPITFFEITTAAALLAFAEQRADVVLLEVGLGGRFDTTNVVKAPALTVITPISMDHTDKLGNSLAKIAFEKAGILKPNVPAVIAAQPDEAFDTILEVAASVDAPLVLWGQDFDAYEQNGRLIYQGSNRLMDLSLPSLAGKHQIRNAGLAIACALQLRKVIPDMRDALSESAIDTGLTEARWPARLQRLNGKDGSPLVRKLLPESELWLDGGHNEAAGQALAQSMADLEERAAKPLVLLVGMMAHKDAAAFLTPFKGLASHIIALPIDTADDAAQNTDDLAGIARSLDFSAEAAPDPMTALDRVRALIDGPVRVLICGSLYLAGSVLALQNNLKGSSFPPEG